MLCALLSGRDGALEGNQLFNLAVFEFHAFCVSSVLIIHLRRRWKFAPVCLLGFSACILPSFSYHFLSLKARKCSLRPLQNCRKDDVLCSFLLPFVSSTGYVLWLNLIPIVRAYFCMNYYYSQILPLFLHVIKKLL